MSSEPLRSAPPTHAAHAPEVLVSLRGVSKSYRLYDRPADRLREALWRGRRSYAREFWALRDVSLEVRRGETVGVIGRNGCGKSTLLQLVAGTLTPTRGSVSVTGRVAPLLELGSGFNPEFTGRENVFLNGAILGVPSATLRARMQDILAFADIGEYVDQPVKTYSTGMFVRLAFAVAVMVDPDVLVIDEALAVGDTVFQHRCMRKIQEFRAAGKTILFVSHDSSAITTLCNRAVWLHEGRERVSGDPERVVKEYLAFAYAETERELAGAEPPASASAERAAAGRARSQGRDTDGLERRESGAVVRFGNGAARVVSSRILDRHGRERHVFQAGEPVTVEIVVRLRAALARPIVGFQIRDRFGTELTSTNTAYESAHLPPGGPGAGYRVSFTFAWPDLAESTYTLSPGIADGTVEAHLMCDWLDDAHVLKSRSERHVLGLLRLGGVRVRSELLEQTGEPEQPEDRLAGAVDLAGPAHVAAGSGRRAPGGGGD
jgi:lipopolysaccharide transport system ATP-binding protein